MKRRRIQTALYGVSNFDYENQKNHTNVLYNFNEFVKVTGFTKTWFNCLPNWSEVFFYYFFFFLSLIWSIKLISYSLRERTNRYSFCLFVFFIWFLCLFRKLHPSKLVFIIIFFSQALCLFVYSKMLISTTSFTIFKSIFRGYFSLNFCAKPIPFCFSLCVYRKVKKANFNEENGIIFYAKINALKWMKRLFKTVLNAIFFSFICLLFFF